MKTNSQTKMLTLILSILILFQGCTVYKSANVSLDESVKKEDKTKIVTTTGERLKFKRIAFENGTYYGIKKSSGELVKFPLKNDEIKNIRLKDNAMSTISTILLPVGALVILVLVVEDAMDWDFYSDEPISY